MPILCRVDIERCEEIFKELEDFVKALKETLSIHRVYLFGSFAKGTIHQGSDIDLIIVGDFKERFIERIGKVMDMTELPLSLSATPPRSLKACWRRATPSSKRL